MQYKNYSDKQIVQGILNNDEQLIRYFFFEKCSSLFNYIVASVFDGKVDKDELISELYIYLSDKNWYKVRLFDYRSSLLTWLSVVSIRFFIKKREKLIENISSKALFSQNDRSYNLNIENKIDLYSAISRMHNRRYAKILEELDIQEKDPKQVALRMGITLDNLYNLRKRARLQLKTMLDYNDK